MLAYSCIHLLWLGYQNCLCEVFWPYFLFIIAIRIDGYLSNHHSINSGVPQGSVMSPALFILFINDLLSSTSSSIFSFADDTYLSSSFSSNPQHLAYSNISPYHNTSASLLTNDLTNVEKWGSGNLVKFNEGKTTSCHNT